MFLLDTNVVSELVKRAPHPQVLARLRSELPAHLFINPVIVFELRFGAARSDKPATLWAKIQREVLARFRPLPFEVEDALAAADLLATQAGAGRNLAVQDILLAGAAHHRNLTLVTRNVRHFEGIAGLKIENWFEPPPPAPASEE